MDFDEELIDSNSAGDEVRHRFEFRSFNVDFENIDPPVAERVNQLPAGETLGHESELAEMVLDIADGKNSLANESAQLLQSLPVAFDPQRKAAELRDSMQQAAMHLVEWYRRQYVS